MRIEIYEYKPDEQRTECRTYDIADNCCRVLVDANRPIGEVWGFDQQGGQCEGALIATDSNVVLA